MKAINFVLQIFLLSLFLVTTSFVAAYLWIDPIDENSNFFTYLTQRPNSLTYDYYARKHFDDPVVNDVLELCHVMQGKEQVRCVVKQYNHLFEYQNHTKIIRSPEEMRDNGGVCRDAVVFYSTIFKQLGYEVSYSYPFEFHVYIQIRKAMDDYWMYCDIDQGRFNCVEIA